MIKSGTVRPVDFFVLEHITIYDIFVQFVRVLLKMGILIRVTFVLLISILRTIKGTLLTYMVLSSRSKFNWMFFHTLIEQLASIRARYKCSHRDAFKQAIIDEINNFHINDIVSFYRTY